jgi:hypothetical protein
MCYCICDTATADSCTVSIPNYACHHFCTSLCHTVVVLEDAAASYYGR